MIFRSATTARALLMLALGLGGCGEQKPAPPKAPPGGDVPPKALTWSGADASGTAATAPAVNWILPLFTDREGYRSMTLRGTAVRPGSGNSIAVEDFSITIFNSEADAQVDSILLSPSANFFPKENRASGEKSVRFIRDDYEVQGADWSYDHASKKVSINRDVRVTFHAQLNDILR